MYDKFDKIGRSTIQHGPRNNRIYLMKLHQLDAPRLPDQLVEFAKKSGYTKIFTKVPESLSKYFLQKDYTIEASIPKFFHNREDVLFLSKFLDQKRAELTPEEDAQISATILLAKQKSGVYPFPLPAKSQTIRTLTPADLPDLARLYRDVFTTYPFPIHETGYLKETMANHIIYYGIFEKERLVSASSAETDPLSDSVEMTDFATLPAARGKSLARILLNRMEHEMQLAGFHCHYTIARALSPGMNITFAKCGYTFGGTLINNTDITGNIESMNIWYKHVVPYEQNLRTNIT